MNYLDAFSGIGGFHRGLEEAGFRFDWVGFSEIDKHAKQIYKRRFPGAEDLGDVRTIVSSGRLPGRLDLFTFGFPCQDLSMAGKRRGLHASRSGLFFEALQIIKAARPTVFIFENVKGLLSSSDWRDFTTVLRAIADIGLYECEWQLLNTQWFLPQNRERVYFIGHLRGESRPKVFPFGEDDKEIADLQRKLRGQIQPEEQGRGRGYSDEPVLEAGEDGHLHKVRIIDGFNGRETGVPTTIRANMNAGALVQVMDSGRNSQGSRIYSHEGSAATLNAGGKGLYATPIEVPAKARTRQNGKRIKGPEEPMFTLTCQDRHGVIVHSLQPRSPERPSLKNRTSSGGSGPLNRDDGNTYCLDRGNCQAVETVTGIRRLTPLECERLQGFPDGWTAGISDTQRYRCLGNAVSVPVVRAIGERLKRGWISNEV